MTGRGAGIALALFLSAPLVVSASPVVAPVLRAEEWTQRSPTFAYDLTQAPGECLAQSSDDIEVGRALFRSTALLGGPAARVGLSCEACHAGGRINRHFLLPELSDAPATVDVTSEWASKLRGDGVRNPVPIPDLVGVRDRASFGGRHEPSLEAFVRGVIVEEFQGGPPSHIALEGVLAYLRALDPAACRSASRVVTLHTAADDVRRAVDAAARTGGRGDGPTSSMLLYAAQDAVARIVERLPDPLFARDRATLTQLSRELGALRNGDVAANLTDARTGWMARFDATARRIARRQARTYFNPRVLARAQASRAPR